MNLSKQYSRLKYPASGRDIVEITLLRSFLGIIENRKQT